MSVSPLPVGGQAWNVTLEVCVPSSNPYHWIQNVQLTCGSLSWSLSNSSPSTLTVPLLPGGALEWAPTGASKANPASATAAVAAPRRTSRSEEHTSELQSRENLVCRLLLEKKKKQQK